MKTSINERKRDREREWDRERGRDREREITHQASPSVIIFFSTYIQIIEKKLQRNEFCESAPLW